jgi:hypothetical protein
MQEGGETGMNFPQSVYLIDLRQITHITTSADIWNSYNTYSHTIQSRTVQKHHVRNRISRARNLLLVVALFDHISLLAQLGRRKLLCIQAGHKLHFLLFILKNNRASWLSQ